MLKSFSICTYMFTSAVVLKLNNTRINCLSPNFLKYISSFKIDSKTLVPDPNWVKILEPESKSMYLDPRH